MDYLFTGLKMGLISNRNTSLCSFQLGLGEFRYGKIRIYIAEGTRQAGGIR
jgi:hypothetical protein